MCVCSYSRSTRVPSLFCNGRDTGGLGLARVIGNWSSLGLEDVSGRIRSWIMTYGTDQLIRTNRFLLSSYGSAWGHQDADTW